MAVVKKTRVLRYVCACGYVETQVVEISKQVLKPPPDEEAIACTCDKCYSDRLDAIYPGARERMNKRLAAERLREKQREARAAQ